MFAETTCLDRIKSLDVYRRVSNDYVQTSVKGKLRKYKY